jgi:alkanesulfonate monooxygenase SsuD/methylene tetrahydromethanopterin reductase-like flavin-dependent oxidoreductase (luciferase family)
MITVDYTKGETMKFALLYEIECPRPWQEDSISNCFWEALEQVKIAEEAGFHTVWSVEHHFLDQFSVASAPEIWLSAVAQHTSRIRIGHGVRLLPYNYNNPIRAAEMAATLDIMSRGRLEFGTGRSAYDPEDVDGGGVLLGFSQLQDAAAQRAAQARPEAPPAALDVRHPAGHGDPGR